MKKTYLALVIFWTLVVFSYGCSKMSSIPNVSSKDTAAASLAPCLTAASDCSKSFYHDLAADSYGQWHIFN